MRILSRSVAVLGLIVGMMSSAHAQDIRRVAMAYGVHLRPNQRPVSETATASNYTALINAARALSVSANSTQDTSSSQNTPAPPIDDRLMDMTANVPKTRLGTPELPADLASLLPNGVGPVAPVQGTIAAPSAQMQAPSPSLLGDADAGACARYIPEAEARFGIPAGILRAVNMVESGGWPWTLNVGGRAVYPQTMAEAMRYMGDQRGFIRPDVAVGCMQIYTRYHSQRFQDAAHMIDPRTNVYYAAYYLSTLYHQYGSWQEAVGRYHSSQQSYQRVYLCSVVKRRIQFGYQHVNAWYDRTCGGSDPGVMSPHAIMVAYMPKANRWHNR